MTAENNSRDETIRVFVNEAEGYINHMKLLVSAGSNFEFGRVRSDFKSLLKLVEKKDYFPRDEIDRLRTEYNSIADPRVLQHLEENFGF